MGIAFEYVRKMDELGLLRRGMSILDVGSSNLYSASQREIADFVREYAPSSGSEIEEFAARLAQGSAYDPVKGGRNEAFIGELFERAGMNYVSIDIADGYRTRILDLNHGELPPELRGAFDLVLNFGTTEHVLNQWNSFKIVHDAAKVGAHIYHSLPAIGYVDHGYITYTGRCFFDLAGHNGYEIVACWFTGPHGRNRVTASLEAYAAHFPALKSALEALAATEQGRALRELAIPDIGINVVFRKTQNKPFFGALDSSTSVGAIPLEVTAGDGIGVVAATAISFRDRIKKALARHPLLYGVARRFYQTLLGRSPIRPRNRRDRSMRAIKQRITHLLAHRGHRGAKERPLQASDAPQPDSIPNSEMPQDKLLAALREIICRVQPRGQPRLEGYQLEMAAYNLRTGMGDAEGDFFRFYERCSAYSMTSWERLYNLYLAVRYIVKCNIPGDLVECGVWRGGSMMMVALALLSLGRTDRRLLLFDTYEGLPMPDEILDIDIWGNRAIDGWRPHRRTDQSSDWAYASLQEVRSNMEGTGYPMSRISFVKGMVETTLPSHAPDTIALLRIDTDWYSSTRHALAQLYPRLSPGGVLILDDYGHFRGARKAADEYFDGVGMPPLLTRVDYAGRVAIKPC